MRVFFHKQSVGRTGRGSRRVGLGDVRHGVGMCQVNVKTGRAVHVMRKIYQLIRF